MKLRKISVATVAASALVLSACAQGGSTQEVPPENESISFFNWFYDGAMKEAYDTYIASFTAENEAVSTVEVETQPFTRYNDVLNVRLAANQPPNVSWINASVGPQFVSTGRLMDLTPFIEEIDGFDLEDFPEASLAPWRDGDRLVALPFTNANNVLYFNADVFTAAGIPNPLQLLEEGRWTWETLKESAAAIVESGVADYGFLFNNNIFTPGFRNLIEIYAPYGAAPWSADGTQCTFNSPEAVEATQLVWDMIYEDGSHPGPGVAADFAAGNVAMSLGRQNVVNRLAEVPFGWDVVPAPEGPAGYVPSLAQNGIAAWADVPGSADAARFVVHTMIRENAAIFAGNGPSARSSLQNIETLTSVPTAFTEEQLQRAVIVSLAAPNFVLEYSHPNYAAVERNANLVFDAEVWKPDADVATALDNVCGSVQPLMAP